MSKHTPGPWFVRDFRESYMRQLGWTGPSIDRILITNKTGAEIEASAGADCVVARIQFDNREEALGDGNLADAQLIAAAPELLDALTAAKEVVDVAEKLTGCRGDDDWIWGVQAKIAAALAKAGVS